MATQLLPELARENAASNRRAAQIVDAARRQLESLESSLGSQPEEVRRWLSRSARQALRYTLAQMPMTSALWQDILAVFEEGLRAEEAKELIRFAHELAETWSELVRSTRVLWEVAARAGAAPEGSHELDAAERRVQELKNAIGQTHAFLNRPRPPVDPGALDAAGAAVAEGRYKTPEDIRARFRGCPA